MPVPKPRKDESRKKFIKRCAKLLAKRDPDTKHKKRVAICFKAWRKKKKS